MKSFCGYDLLVIEGLNRTLGRCKPSYPDHSLKFFSGKNMSENEFMKEQEQWNDILDTLRESGAMNMFGAPRWLNEEFGIPMHQAKEIFTAWTLTKTE